MRLSEVRGQPSTVLLLRRLAIRGRLPSALLFEGPPGCGRRTLALALAQAILCDHPVEGDSCGECASCRLAEQGDHPDIVQSHHDSQPLPTADEWRKRGYDGYSDWIRREIGEQAFVSTLLGRGRVFIIHSVDRLHPAAANGLLKALEEPPAGVRFLLTTEQSAAVMSTIRSRSQRYRLQPLDGDTVAALLIRHGIPSSEAHRRAGASDGGHRGCWSPLPAVPLTALRRLATEGFRSEWVAECVAALPTIVPPEADAAGQSLAAVHRQVVRRWLRMLVRELRQDLPGPDPLVPERLLRCQALERDLQLNIQPRLVLEALGVGTLEAQLRR